MLLAGNAIGELPDLYASEIEATAGRLEYSLRRSLAEWTHRHDPGEFTFDTSLAEWTMTDNTHAPEVPTLVAGEVRDVTIDCGDSTEGLETGFLRAGALINNVTATVHSKPSGADDPDLDDFEPNAAAVWCAGRECAEGEAITGRITLASDQDPGLYTLKLVATLDSGEVVPRFVSFEVR